MSTNTLAGSRIFSIIFIRQWPKWLGGIMLALLNIGLFLYFMPLFGVYPAMADWGIWAYKLLGLDIPTPWGAMLELPHLSSRSMVNFGLLAGALIGALLSGAFMIRKATLRDYIQSASGGALMGLGSFLVGSCIIGGFYSSIMALSLSGFYMMAGLLAGAFLADRIPVFQKKDLVDSTTARDNSDDLSPLTGIILFMCLLIISAAYVMYNRSTLAGVILFSAAFGLVFQRSGIGFSSAFTEVFSTRKKENMRALVISLIIGVIGFSIIKANGIKPAHMFVSPAGWHTVIGGMIFGFGMIMADG